VVGVGEGEQSDQAVRVVRIGMVDMNAGRPDLVEEGLGVTAEQ
jgi:hypothetical protein